MTQIKIQYFHAIALIAIVIIPLILWVYESTFTHNPPFFRRNNSQKSSLQVGSAEIEGSKLNSSLFYRKPLIFWGQTLEAFDIDGNFKLSSSTEALNSVMKTHESFCLLLYGDSNFRNLLEEACKYFESELEVWADFFQNGKMKQSYCRMGSIVIGNSWSLDFAFPHYAHSYPLLQWQEDPIHLLKATLQEFQRKACGGKPVNLVIINHITWTVTAWFENSKQIKSDLSNVRRKSKRTQFQSTVVDWFDVRKLKEFVQKLEESIATVKSVNPGAMIALHTVPKTPGLCPGMRPRGSDRMPPYVIHALNCAVRSIAAHRDVSLLDFANWLEGFVSDPEFTKGGVHYAGFVYQNYLKVILNFLDSGYMVP